MNWHYPIKIRATRCKPPIMAPRFDLLKRYAISNLSLLQIVSMFMESSRYTALIFNSMFHTKTVWSIKGMLFLMLVYQRLI